MTNDEHAYLWRRRCALKERAELSVLYHRKRERAFDLADRWCKAIAIIGGTAAFTALGGASITKIVAAGIAVTSTFSLVFAFSDRGPRRPLMEEFQVAAGAWSTTLNAGQRRLPA